MLICIFGKRGSGKTTFIKGQLKDCRGPVIVVDILGNFDSPDFIQVSKVSDAITELENYSRSENKKELNKIIVVKTPDPDLAVDFMSAALWESGGGTLVLDEADGFSITNAPCYDQLIRYGRNRNVDLITGCRRPAEISRHITAGANQIFIFQTQEPRDIDYFESTILGTKAQNLVSIPKFHGLFVDYDESETGLFAIDEKGSVYKLSRDNF